MVQEVIGFQEPRGWPRSYEVKRPSTGGSGGHRDLQEFKRGPGGYGVKRPSTGVSGGHQDFRSPRGGQEAMGSGDLVQEVQGVIGIPVAQGVARRVWGLET